VAGANPNSNTTGSLFGRFRRILAWILSIFALLVLLVSFTPVDEWWAYHLAGPWRDPNGDILIVLGGGVLEDGTIGEGSYWRSVYAARAWHSDDFKTIVVIGGPPQNPVAMPMKQFLIAQGVPSDSIVVETNSTSTRENAMMSLSILNHLPGRKVLMTSDYHMHRAERTFEKLGVGVAPRPIPDAIKRAQLVSLRWDTFLDLCAEELRTLYYRWKGWI
jgi:uncharacterized SAM-binding protein YcdF (DUF218 family)